MVRNQNSPHWYIIMRNPGGWVPIMFSQWLVLYRILIRAVWVRVGWFRPGCMIYNIMMWSSICFVYLLCKEKFIMESKCSHRKKYHLVNKAFSPQSRRFKMCINDKQIVFKAKQSISSIWIYLRNKSGMCPHACHWGT